MLRSTRNMLLPPAFAVAYGLRRYAQSISLHGLLFIQGFPYRSLRSLGMTWFFIITCNYSTCGRNARRSAQFRIRGEGGTPFLEKIKNFHIRAIVYEGLSSVRMQTRVMVAKAIKAQVCTLLSKEVG